jgi:transposase
MGMAQLVVAAVVVERRSKSEVARQYGVSRRWVTTLVQRYLAEGEAGLEPRSRRPLRSPRRTPVEVEDEIVKLRKELDRGGHEAGAATIAFHLEQQRGASPAVSTIWRILTARGFVTPQPHKRPKSSYTRFVAEQPNERWQLDITHWVLADDTEVEILNLLDDHSRFCVGSHTRRVFKAGDVDACFGNAATRYGDPATVLSDNGAVFTGRSRGQGRLALESPCTAEGSGSGTPGLTTPRPAARSNGSTRPSRSGSRPGPGPAPCGSSKPSSTASAATTTPSGRTAPLVGAPRSRPTRPGPRLPRPACPSGTPLPHPPRQDRSQRRVHPAAQQPTPPHRRRPTPRRPRHPRPGLRPPRPRPHPRRRTPPRAGARPLQGLPTTAPNVNDVARHLCTVSRDITVEPPAGIEPATPSLPWNHREPLCGPPFPQVMPDRKGRSYRFSFSEVMRSL